MAKKAPAKRSKKTNPDLAADIKRAAGTIPGLIAEDMDQPETREDAGIHRQQKRQLVWIGVALIGILTLVLWYNNTRLMFAKLSQTPSAEGQLLGSAATDFSQILDAVNTSNAEPAQAAPSEALKQKVSDALQSSLATTTSTTSSTDASTTTEQKPVGKTATKKKP